MYVCKNWTYTLDTVDLYYTNLINTYSIFYIKYIDNILIKIINLSCIHTYTKDNIVIITIIIVILEDKVYKTLQYFNFFSNLIEKKIFCNICIYIYKSFKENPSFKLKKLIFNLGFIKNLNLIKFK